MKNMNRQYKSDRNVFSHAHPKDPVDKIMVNDLQRNQEQESEFV